MAPKAGRVRDLAKAAARSATGGEGNPLTRMKRRAETAEEQVAALQAQRDRLVRERDAARSQVDTLRRQGEVLREQRERGRAAQRALAAVARLLEVDADPAQGIRPLRQALNQIRAEAQIADGLLHGRDLDESAVRAVRALLVNPQSIARARALCTALQADERTRMGGTVALGHYLLVWGSRRTAHEEFSKAPLDLVVRAAAVEAVRSALHVDRPAGLRLAEQVVEHPDLAAEDAFGVAGVLVGHSERDLARRALARAQGATDAQTAEDVARLGRWLDDHPTDLDTVAPTRSRPVIGVLTYDHPQQARSSSDLGDHGQTVAVLSHLARRRGLSLHAADADLQEALDTLRADVPAGSVLDTPAAEVDVVAVSRDASRDQALPDPTWLVTAGWFLQSIFGVRTDLPFHPAIRPVFLGFHLGRPEVLTPDAVAYLRRYGPVGCRDWTTVDLLLSYGVDAFFSGDVTTTVSLPAAAGDPAPPTPDSEEDPRHRTLGRNLLAAHARHRRIASAGSLETADLHEYLAGVALGVPVEFRPPLVTDGRLDGLSDLTPGSPALGQMRQRISGLLDLFLGLVTAGAGEDDVRAAWRDATEPLVEQARARREHWRSTSPPVESLAGAAGPVRDAAVHHGEGGDLHVAISLDQNLIDVTPVVLQGIDEHTDRDVRVHVLTRGVPTDVVEGWARTFPRLRFSHYRFDDVQYGSIARLLAHTTVSTMDRLLLPDVLADLDRVVYIDIDVTVLGDVGELWDLELGGAPLAARPTASEWAESGLAFIYRAAQRLPVDVARELRAYMHARLSGDFVSFNAGILVLDLDRMRSDKFAEHFAGMAGRYGLNDQDVLCCYAGTEAVALDPRWNSFPTREPLADDVRLVHFAGGAKPWGALPVPAKERWVAARDRYLARLGPTLGA